MTFPVYEDGQPIIYTGGHHDTVTRCLIGKEGTARCKTPDYPDRDTIDIEIGGETYNVFKANVAVRATKQEIDKALRLLKSVGTVSFTPNKQPFIPRTVTLNAGYKAVISDKDVQVGCQVFNFSAIEDVYNAVQAARAYNREPHSD